MAPRLMVALEGSLMVRVVLFVIAVIYKNSWSRGSRSVLSPSPLVLASSGPLVGASTVVVALGRLGVEL